ncbi:MAG: FAD-dependent oxidoreductase [Planctomycetota bacterium]
MTARANARAEPGSSALVVGGGVVGIACAHYLNRAGFRVTVIDAKGLASECSHANCGYISPSHVLPLTEPESFHVAFKSLLRPNAPFRVQPGTALRHLGWFLQFARRCNRRQMLFAGQHLKAILDSSRTEYDDIISTHHLDCQYRATGLLFVLQSSAGWKAFEHTDRFLTEHFGVQAEAIAGAELPDFDAALKPGLKGAFYYPGDASVRPDQLCAQWVDCLKRRGVEFRERCPAMSVQRDGVNVVGIQTPDGLHSADQVVFCLGSHSSTLQGDLGCKLPVLPGKGYSVTMRRPKVCPEYPMLFPEHKVGVSPFADGYRLGSMMEFAGFDSSIPEKRISQLKHSAEPYLKEPYASEELERWYGWRPMTWDSLPIIGPIAKHSNAYVAAGHNMLGLSLAPATGRLISEMIMGVETHIDASAYSVQRFS